jgi:hypothetical protein
MMTRAQRREAALRQRWLAILQAELLRREEEDGGDRREQVLGELIAKLDQMAERLAMAPDYVPPTPEEAAATAREIDTFFRQFATSRAT